MHQICFETSFVIEEVRITFVFMLLTTIQIVSQQMDKLDRHTSTHTHTNTQACIRYDTKGNQFPYAKVFSARAGHG